jgi:UDP:flavonoid glycosyltransferase YjiC (YdhE family)
MPTLVCYISGHGFGHAVRVMEVLRALWSRRPDVHVAIRSSVPRWFFDLAGPFTHAFSQLDVGAVQADSLSVDIEATLRAYAAMAARKEELINHEVATVTAQHPRLILADIPALAFDVAERLGVAAVGMTNFSWDWIYADYVSDFPGYAGLVDDLRHSYGRASLLLRLPLHGDLGAFPRIRDVPLVARTATKSRADVRQRLGLPLVERIVLLSFGGIGVTMSAIPDPPHGLTFVATQSAAPSTAPRRCRFLPNAEMAAAGVRYEDLVAASDVVMTKPGYGIVGDCLANGTAMIYTSRGRFAEYEYLVAGIEAHLTHRFISNDDLRAGRWLPALDDIFRQPRRAVQVETGGAAVAADVLLGMMGE